MISNLIEILTLCFEKMQQQKQTKLSLQRNSDMALRKIVTTLVTARMHVGIAVGYKQK